MRHVMLLGGPLNGRIETIHEGASLELHSGGVKHTYAAGANLPDDIRDRLAPQSHLFEPWGYQGPDRSAVEALRLAFPEHAPAEAV